MTINWILKKAAIYCKILSHYWHSLLLYHYKTETKTMLAKKFTWRSQFHRVPPPSRTSSATFCTSVEWKSQVPHSQIFRLEEYRRPVAWNTFKDLTLKNCFMLQEKSAICLDIKAHPYCFKNIGEKIQNFLN